MSTEASMKRWNNPKTSDDLFAYGKFEKSNSKESDEFFWTFKLKKEKIRSLISAFEKNQIWLNIRNEERK